MGAPPAIGKHNGKRRRGGVRKGEFRKGEFRRRFTYPIRQAHPPLSQTLGCADAYAERDTDLRQHGYHLAGIGWDYGKRSQWETHLLFGIVPKYDSDEVKMTITLKENFIPWRKDWGKGWQFEPLECTLYLNTVLGHDFWTKQPTKYESGYYPFSTRIRPNLGFGERFTYQIPNNRRKRVKSLTLFYELSTNDIYFMRFYRNGNAGFWDVFGLSFGAKMQIL